MIKAPFLVNSVFFFTVSHEGSISAEDGFKMLVI